MADLVKNIAIATAILTAAAANPEVITKDEAFTFGYHIVADAACGTRFATSTLAKYLNEGAKLNDLKPLKSEIVHGKELAKASLAEKGKPAFCDTFVIKTETVINRATDAHTLGFTAAQDELCGTHSYNAVMIEMRKEGELYPGMLKDYAEEFEEGKRLGFSGFESEGETKYCRFRRREEREDADLERITRALGVYETPYYKD
jgi:hypothetical protein